MNVAQFPTATWTLDKMPTRDLGPRPPPPPVRGLVKILVSPQYCWSTVSNKPSHIFNWGFFARFSCKSYFLSFSSTTKHWSILHFCFKFIFKNLTYIPSQGRGRAGGGGGGKGYFLIWTIHIINNTIKETCDEVSFKIKRKAPQNPFNNISLYYCSCEM